MKNDEVAYKIGQLEGNYTSIMNALDKITNNHLPHIQTALDDNVKQHEAIKDTVITISQNTNDKIDSIKIKIAYWLGALAVITFLLGLLAQYLMKHY